MKNPALFAKRPEIPGVKLLMPTKIPDEIAAGLTPCFEAFNKSDETVYLVNEILGMNINAAYYIMLRDKNLGPQVIEIKSKAFKFIPHQFYYIYTRSGGPAVLLKNFGRMKGVKNTLPSAPENWTKKHF